MTMGRNCWLIQPQKIIEIDPAAHGIRLDVYADDDENTRYSVEMQKKKKEKRRHIVNPSGYCEKYAFKGHCRGSDM